MERRSLGKGISALIPEREASSPSGATNVQFHLIRPNPFQPREDFDEQSINDLAQSIKEKGVIQPLLVRRKGDFYELIAGERRWRAANLLGLKELPVIIKEVDDRDSLELALIENIQREDLNPIEEARAYQFLFEKFQVTHEKMSAVLGKARATITNTLRLLKLPQEIQQEIKKKRLTFGHAKVLLEVADANEQRRLCQEVITKDLSVRELESLIKVHRPKAFKRRMVPRQREHLVAVLEEELQHLLATKIRINKGKKRGHILIEFYSNDDLQRIAAILRGGAR